MFIMAGLFMALYSGAGAISYQSGVFLPMPEFERSIPFLNWTIWIYIVLYPIYIIWALANYKNEGEMNKTVYGFILLTVISCLLFILFPVNYPRELYPLAPGTDITTQIFMAMRVLDKPSNCLPSLHVGICYLFAYAFLKESRGKFIISFLISSLIAYSTLTTKQHYIYDIALGFLLSSAIYFFLRFKCQIKSSSQQK